MLTLSLKLPLMVLGGLLLIEGQQRVAAAVSAPGPIVTNFVSGTELSGRDLQDIAKLAGLCGIGQVSAVSTERHLSGISIRVRGDERTNGRKVVFKTLLFHREGWPGGERRPTSSLSVGSFWIGPPGQPNVEERTIVRIGNRTVQVLVNGLKPSAADQIVGAFAQGRIQYASDYLRQRLSGTDCAKPASLGILDGGCWISFSSHPLTRFRFEVKGDEVVVLEVIDVYE